MESATQIRLATSADAFAIAHLASEWGYPETEDLTRTRLEKLLSSHNHLAIVADTASTTVAWATAELRLSLGSDPRVEITGLVVATKFRRAGIGRVLVGRIEAWALERGCQEVFLRSNVVRSEAHPFYERLGYIRTKTQHAYSKVLHAA